MGKIESQVDRTQPFLILRIIARMNVGGPAWQVSVLSTALQDEEFSTVLVSGCVDVDEADFLEVRSQPVQVLRLASLTKKPSLVGDLRTFFELIKLIRTLRPVIVHTHTTKAGLVGRLAAAVCRVPVRVHTFHGHVFAGYFSRPTTRILVLCERWLARISTHLISVGQQVRDELINLGIGDRDRFTVIPPGVAEWPRVSSYEAKQHLEIAIEEKVVLYVGRLVKIKRLDRLLEAMEIVQSVVPNSLLLVAGDGPELQNLKEIASEKRLNIRFLGWRSDLSFLYQSADVVVLTSDNEGMPVSLLEAASCGRPAVATDVGSVREVVIDHDTGFVTKRDASEIAQRISQILMSPNLGRSMGDAASRYFKESFSAERLASDHRKLYRRLISANS